MVSVKNLCKNYCSLNAVDDLSFHIAKGSVTGLLGPNGAGKSTTMRMLTGYLAPTSGSIEIGGVDIIQNPIEARRSIGYLPEIPPVYPDMTVGEHLGFVCELRGVKDAKKETERVCEALNVTDVSGRMIRHLSKGYRQRVGFAAALVGNPKFLVLDEPTVGLDPEQIIQIRDLICTLSGEMSILISSHMLGEISSVCDSLLILKKGKLAASGTREQIEASVRRGSITEICAIGEADFIEALIHSAVPEGKISLVSSCGSEQTFNVFTKETKDVRESIFKIFAQNLDRVSLVTLRSLDKTLEDVFLDIIRE